MSPPTIADQVTDVIRRAGIDTLFCLPGVQNDPLSCVPPRIVPLVSFQATE